MLSAAFATEWWTGPMCGWCAHDVCTSALRLGSWRTQLNGTTTITCPNPASHSARQHISLGPLVAQVRNTLNVSSLADRAILTERVLQAQRLFPEATTVQEVVDLTRVATTIREAEADEDGRGEPSPQQNKRMSCGVCGEVMERRDVLDFSGWTIHPRCALNTAEGASDAGEDRFGIEVIG